MAGNYFYCKEHKFGTLQGDYCPYCSEAELKLQLKITKALLAEIKRTASNLVMPYSVDKSRALSKAIKDYEVVVC